MGALDNEFVDHHYSATVLKNLEILQLSKRLCDATLEAGPVKFYVHRLILIAMIPKLNQLQFCDMGKPLEVILPATIKAEALNTIVHYLYTGTLHLTPQNFPWVEQIIHLLGLTKLYPNCEQYQFYLRRKKMVTPATELFKNPILVQCESEKAVQVYYLESEQQLPSLQRQLSLFMFPSVIKNISVLKQEDSQGRNLEVETKNSELTLNHSDFTLGTFLESSSSKERLQFQICSNTKKSTSNEPNVTESSSFSFQKPSAEASSCTASETGMYVDLQGMNGCSTFTECEPPRENAAIANLNEMGSKTDYGKMETDIGQLVKIKLEPMSEDEVDIKDKNKDERVTGTERDCQFSKQKFSTSALESEHNNQMPNDSTNILQENEDFTLCCPLCLINFNSEKSFGAHQKVCFNTFHHNQLARQIAQNDKMLWPCTSGAGANSRVPYQSSASGRTFSFVRPRQKADNRPAPCTSLVSPEREQTKQVLQRKADSKMENPANKRNSENLEILLANFEHFTKFTAPGRLKENQLYTGRYQDQPLLSSTLRDGEASEKNRTTVNHSEDLQLNNSTNTGTNIPLAENGVSNDDDNDLKLKITDVWTLQGLEEHVEPLGDSQESIPNTDENQQKNIQNNGEEHLKNTLKKAPNQHEHSEEHHKKLLGKAADQHGENKSENRSEERSTFLSLYDVVTIGDKLYLRKKPAQGNQDVTKTCAKTKSGTSKASRQKKKHPSTETGLPKKSRTIDASKQGFYPREAPDNLAEKTKNRNEEHSSSDSKKESEKIVITQTPIKKLTSIITAVSEGENAHLLKTKQGICKEDCSSKTEKESNLPSTSTSKFNCTSSPKLTERKVYEFKENTAAAETYQGTQNSLGITDDKSSKCGGYQHQPSQLATMFSPTICGTEKLTSLSKAQRKDEPTGVDQHQPSQLATMFSPTTCETERLTSLSKAQRKDEPSCGDQHQPSQLPTMFSPTICGTEKLSSISKAQRKDEPTVYNLVNTYKYKNKYSYRMSPIDEKIARVHRENCIVIPKEWNVPRAVTSTCIRRYPNESEDAMNRDAPGKKWHQYTIPLKKRKQ